MDKKSLSASKSKDDSIKDDKKNEEVKKDNSENKKDDITKDVASILGKSYYFFFKYTPLCLCPVSRVFQDIDN